VKMLKTTSQAYFTFQHVARKIYLAEAGGHDPEAGERVLVARQC
jgi:hypothetical protein